MRAKLRISCCSTRPYNTFWIFPQPNQKEPAADREFLSVATAPRILCGTGRRNIQDFFREIPFFPVPLFRVPRKKKGAHLPTSFRLTCRSVASRVQSRNVHGSTKPSSHAGRQLQWVVICLQERRSKPWFKIEDRLVHRLGRSRWVEILTYVSDLSVLGDQKHHVLLTINPASSFDQRFRFDLNDRS